MKKNAENEWFLLKQPGGDLPESINYVTYIQRPISARPLMAQLEFIKNKQKDRWGVAFMNTPRSISFTDYRTIVVQRSPNSNTPTTA